MKPQSEPKILIAGGSGLVGSALCRHFQTQQVPYLASYHSRPHKDLDPSKYRSFDFTQTKDCLEATRGMNQVFLCAALTTGAQGQKNSATASLRSNLEMTSGLMEAAYTNGVKHLVVLSSSTVYPDLQRPITEDDLDLNVPPFRLYDVVGGYNRYLESLAKIYHQRYGMDVTIVRPSSIYGPNDKFEVGKSNVLPALIRRAIEKQDPFTVWGDGTAVRDFIYVDDFVDALLRVSAVERTARPVNIGSETAMTIREATEIVLETSCHLVTPVFDPTQPTAIPYRVLDCSLLKKLVSEYTLTPFNKGVLQTITWYKKFS